MDSKIFRGALEAYHSIYNEDLREEIQFENWVNSLVQEGYDLSEYTWEDMYEVYISEMGQVRTTGQTSSVFRPTPGAGSAGGSGSGGRRGGGSSPGALKPAAAPAKPQPQMKGLSIGQGGFRVNNRPVNTGVSPIFQRPGATPRPAAPARPASTAPRPAAAPTTRPVATAPRPTTATPAAKPAPTVATKPVTQPPESRSQASAGEIRGMVGRSMERQAATSAAKPTPTAPSRPMGSRKPGSIVSGLDMFDLVKGHLLDEGYADTEEAALVIMANMSEDWRESILDEASRRDEFTRAAIARSSGRKGGITFEPGPNWDASANRGKGAHISPKQKEKQRRKALRQEN